MGGGTAQGGLYRAAEDETRMKVVAAQILGILVASAVLGAIANAVHPNGIPWVIDPATSLNPAENRQLAEQASISLEELRKLIEEGSVTMVDARKPEAFLAGHLATAVNIPATEKLSYLDSVHALIPPEGIVVIYCGGGDCGESNEVFEFLAGVGYQKDSLRIFIPGWEILGEQDDLAIEGGRE